MNLFLEIAARLCGADGAQFLDWGFQQLGNVFLDLFAKARISKSLAQRRILDMGKSAAQGTLHNVIINHRQPRSCGEYAETGAAQHRIFVALLQKERQLEAVTRVAGVCDWSHRWANVKYALSRTRFELLVQISIGQITPPEQRLQSVHVSQATIERVAEGQAALVWPAVKSGKTTGVLSMYISVDRQGQVREAYPLNADNAGLQDAARDQLLKWKLKPMAANEIPVQGEAALTFRFETTLAADALQPVAQAAPTTSGSAPGSAVKVSPVLLRGFLVDHTAPVYPPDAKLNRIQGRVVLALIIDKTGAPRDIRELTSPNQSLTDSAIAAVSKWRYQPYQLNGSPVEVQSEVEVNFVLP